MINIERNNTIKKYGIYKLNNPIEFRPEISSDIISIEYGIVISNQVPYLSKYDDKVIIIGYDNQFKKVIKQSIYNCTRNTLGEFIGISSEENINDCNKCKEQLFNNHADKKPYNEDTNRKQFLIDEENRLNKEIVELYRQIKEKEKLLNNVTKKLNEYR